jgi:hypothetical protein
VTVQAPERVRLDLETDPPAPFLAHLTGVRLAIVLWGGLAVTDIWRPTGTPSYVALGAVAVLTMLASLGMRAGTAIGCAGIAWLVVNGFVDHRLGTLGWDGSADLGRLALLIGLAIVATRVHR